MGGEPLQNWFGFLLPSIYNNEREVKGGLYNSCGFYPSSRRGSPYILIASVVCDLFLLLWILFPDFVWCGWWNIYG